MELPPSPPPPPEQVQLDVRAIGRRWKEPPEVAERILVKAGVQLIDIPQPPRKGLTLAELLAFEEHWRQAEAERQARIEAERAELRRREEERDQRHTEARERLRLKKLEADKIVAKAEELQIN
jgi:hypothetical protein